MVIDNFRGEYRWLSNFQFVSIVYEAISYTSTEAAYQAAKTTNRDEKLAISRMSPREARLAGQSVTLRPDWHLIKVSVMEDLTRLKFQDLLLRSKLLDTKDAVLIEGNTWGDQFWGVYNGVGANWLGKTLMRIREEILNDKQRGS